MINPGDFQMATVVCDFIQIIGDAGKPISKTAAGTEVPISDDFKTEGRDVNQTALLMYSANNFTGTAEVFINGNNVGTITATPAGGVYSTQLIGVLGNQLNDGNNEMVLRNVTDAFRIKNVTLFFHQSA
jgi:hypothetical protein